MSQNISWQIVLPVLWIGTQECWPLAVSWSDFVLLKGMSGERVAYTVAYGTYSTAKEKRQFLYSQSTIAASKAHANGPGSSARSGDAKVFDGQVVRVWSGDQISVAEKESGKEHRVQLSSTRAPKYVPHSRVDDMN